MEIWTTFSFGRLDANGNLVRFTPTKGMLSYTDVEGRNHMVMNPSEGLMNFAGWYRIFNVQDDGEDRVIGNILYHYLGKVNYDSEEKMFDSTTGASEDLDAD